MPGSLRATVAGSAGAWRGALADGRHIIWRCPHQHVAREPGSPHFAVSARACAGEMLALVEDASGLYRLALRSMFTAGRGSAGDQLMRRLIDELEPEADRLRQTLLAIP